jgi:hypothetical protein
MSTTTNTNTLWVDCADVEGDRVAVGPFRCALDARRFLAAAFTADAQDAGAVTSSPDRRADRLSVDGFRRRFRCDFLWTD